MAVYKVEKGGKTVKEVEADHYSVKEGLHRFRRGAGIVYSIPVAPDVTVTQAQDEPELRFR